MQSDLAHLSLVVVIVYKKFDTKYFCTLLVVTKPLNAATSFGLLACHPKQQQKWSTTLNFLTIIVGLADWLTNWSNWSRMVWLTGWLIGLTDLGWSGMVWLTGWLADWLAGWLVQLVWNGLGGLADWLTDWSYWSGMVWADWQTGRLTGLTGLGGLTNWLTDWLTDWLIWLV